MIIRQSSLRDSIKAIGASPTSELVGYYRIVPSGHSAMVFPVGFPMGFATGFSVGFATGFPMGFEIHIPGMYCC
ncbi:MAG: hypothetical protein NTX50_10430 [Candidatus Sumerlaeota bacterium]|nr:hypothetical protein [Candidatus Sumerlaeota bacterium]